ncbi:hypothetical protein [Azonexus sp.]|jgi:hypothetical protein|uniref:hypothetical protein n=1 Tax=Azonexus sp. TaxID=1872668 RepID=UPI00282757C1|nr:hypothetical protein [Azonexus sp.]MDR1994068.1 hypothetical protein [Azonexus sp.]
MSSIEAPPLKAPYPAFEFLGSLTVMESYSLYRGCTSGMCDIPVRVGLFFDGTNNHMRRDRDGQRVPVPLTKEEKWAKQREARAAGLPAGESEPDPVPAILLTPEQCFNTNHSETLQ